jgi:8-oxo-dGTP pyrophosphatase MutT (NUDIX family)
MISLTRETHRFDLRAAAIIIHDDRLLVCGFEGKDYVFVPGGRIELGESSDLALTRELEEELGVPVEVGPLLWVTEHFYINDEHLSCHEVGFYYEVRLSDEARHQLDAGPMVIVEGDHRLVVSWLPLDQAATRPLYPEFLAGVLRSLPARVEHLVAVEQRR